MLEGYLWGKPLNSGEGFRPHVCKAPVLTTQCAIPFPQPGVSFSQADMTYSAPLVHTAQQDHGPIFHAESV